MIVWLRWLLVSFVRLVTRVFFRTIEVSGAADVPTDGAVLFIGNHPNSLLDPLMLMTTSPRTLTFAAKEPLFRTPLLPVLRILGAVPVLRRQDQSQHKLGEGEVATDVPANVDNQAAFDALGAVLLRGGAFAIFPEGISHAGPELTPLKTGAARLALQAAERQVMVTVVPVGLTYRRRHRMRSRVLVQYGSPIAIDAALVAQLGAGGHEAAKRLTALFDAALRGLTINAPDFEEVRVIETVRQLYRPRGVSLSLRDQATLMRRFLAGWQRLRDEPAVRRLFEEVRSYRFELQALGIHDGQLRALQPFWSRAIGVTRQVFFLGVMAPVALPGLLLHSPVVIAAILAGENLVARHDVRATMKMCVVTLCVLAMYLAVGAWVWWWVGPLWAFAAVVALSLSGAAALRLLDDQRLVVRGLHTLRMLINMETTLHDLAVRRDNMRGQLLSLVNTHHDPNEPRIIASDAHHDLRWLDDDDDVA